MTRRLATRIAACLLAVVATAGCVTQPMDDSEETILGVNPELGATAAPIAPSEAARAVDDAQELSRLALDAEHRNKGVWIAPRKRQPGEVQGGGLVRVVDPSETAGDDSQSNSDGRTPSRTRDDKPRASQDGDGGGDSGSGDGNGDRSSGNGDGNEDDDRKPSRGGSSPRPRPPAEPTFRALAGATDPGDDASGESPRYADIRQLVIESDGTNARVTVAVAADIPSALTEGEVQGVGVDLYRSNQAESDYQLFIDGDDEGWRAYLQTPEGVVEYPGSFGIGGRVFVLEIPWSALGGRKPADVDMFIDWSKRKTPINDAGNDRAPNTGRVSVDPR